MNLNFVFFVNLLLFGGCLSASFHNPNFNITELFEKYEGRIFNLQVDNNTDVMEFVDSVYIPSYSLFLDLITQFGERIDRIAIVRSSLFDENDWTVLFKRINDHCSESLTSLVLESVKEFTFKNISKPFNKVEKLIFNIKSNEVGTNLPLDVLFPKLNFLRIDYYRLGDNTTANGTRFIDIELPAMGNLEEFCSYADAANASDAVIIKKQLANMFEKNPQIKKLWYGPSVDNFAQEISKHLPNLEDLWIHRVDTNIQPVRFESVKNLISTSWGQPSGVDKITFSNLDSVNMFYDPSIEGINARASWITFFRNHQNLKKLECKPLRENRFVEFVAELPNLHEVTISSFESFNISTVTHLIESANNWSKFHYEANPINAPDHYPDMVPFTEKFGNVWNIVYSFEGRPSVDLERKN